MAFGLFKKKKKSDKQNTGIVELRVKEVVKETPDAVSIHFEHPESGEIEYKSGQYFTIIVDVDGKEERRAYSVCSSPYVDANPAVAVKRVEDGKVSNFLNNELKTGDSIKVMLPLGNFTRDFDKNKKRSLVLIGGGSGITPLMSLAKSSLEVEPNSKVTLLYANRDVESIIFKSQLEALENKNENFSISHVLEKDPDDFGISEGYINQTIISDLVKEVNDNDAEYFVCGPAPMMDIAIESLKNLNVPKEQIKKESFSADVKTPAESSDATDEIVAREVTIIHDDEEYKYVVEPSETILEKGLDENIDLPFSCQSGLCTACRGKCVSGKVKMDESSGLTDAELEEGYVLPCQSHPLTDDVKIEIG